MVWDKPRDEMTTFDWRKLGVDTDEFEGPTLPRKRADVPLSAGWLALISSQPLPIRIRLRLPIPDKLLVSINDRLL